MRRHHVLALIGCAGLSAIALTDAVTHGLTGEYSVFSADVGGSSVRVFVSLVHGFAYAMLALVLVRERNRLRTVPRAARIAGQVATVAFTALAVVFLLLDPVLTVLAVSGGEVWDLIGTLVLLSVLLSTTVLGLALLRRNPLGSGGRLLALVLPVLAVTIGLGLLVPDWAHPGYLETIMNFGVALLGVRVAVVARPPVGIGRTGPTSTAR